MDASNLVSPPVPEVPVNPIARAIRLTNPLKATSEQAFDFVELLSILKRRRKIIIACTAIITAISVAYIYQIVVRYTAEATVMLDARKTQVVDVQAVLSGLPADSAAVRSELEVIRSPAIARQVVNKLNLTAVPEFNTRLEKPSVLAMVTNAPHIAVGYLSSLFEDTPASQPPASDQAQLDLQNTTGTLVSRTETANDGRSYIIKIRVTSENSRLAAAIANTYVDAYLAAQLETKFEAVRRANDWLNEHVADLRQQVEAADKAVQIFRAQHNLTQANDRSISDQQLGEINSQLILATADRAQKESNLNQIQQQLKTGGVAGASQVLSSGLIQNLRQQETDLIRQEAELATKYKPDHPAMINIKAQERDLETKIKSEIDKIIQGMTGDVAAARAKEASMRASLQSLQKTVTDQGQASIQLRELERQAESNRTLYENFLNRFKQTSAQEDIQQSDAHVVADASIPRAPSYPRRGQLITLSFFGALLFGIFAALAVERMDNGFRTSDQVEKFTEASVLGLVPNVDGEGSPHDIVLSSPVSPYSEAIRTVRTALRYSDIDKPPRVIAVTSSLPDEGKSVFALSLARSIAFSGSRTLLIDCDLRRPTLSNLLKLSSKVGLVSLFGTEGNMAAAIQVDKPSKLHFMSSSGGTANPQDLLGSKQFRSIIEKLRTYYDMIIIDSPPVLAVSDALVVSHAADATMFLVRWGRTPRPVVLGALKTFRAHGGSLAGIVLSRVDFRRHAQYGYGDSGYYYGHYGKRYGKYGGYGGYSSSKRA